MYQKQKYPDRRRVLQALSMTGLFLAQGPLLLAQPGPARIRLQKLHCFEIRVRDLDRSLAFYQDLFGMPVLSRFGGRVSVQVGNSSQLMSLRECGAGEEPAITHIGFSVADWDQSALSASLAELGFAQAAAPPLADPGLNHAMKQWLRDRDGTQELYFSDARGLIVQLVASDYCAGSGARGNQCPAPEAPREGLFQLDELNHFTAFVNDGAGANQFWQDSFDLRVQAEQGPGSAVNGIGDGFQFVMFAGPFPGGGNTPANLHHGSFNMHGFDEQEILDKLTSYGLQDRGEQQLGPLMHYVSRRMPARGGAEGGTPEVYFTDPDGILLQLQDTSYCGGGGYLGNECLPA